MYKGKEPCPGCKTSTDIRPRYSKDSLCRICLDELDLGRKVKNEIQQEYYYIFLHYFAFRQNELNNIAHQLLSSLNNPNAHGPIKLIKYSSGNNGERYCIPQKPFDVIKESLFSIEKLFEELEEREKRIPEKAKNEVQKERDLIYNEGVKRGRDLLMQLNNNEITPGEFLRDQKYKQG